MYLHLGGDCVVRTDEIIGIFDLENTTATTNTRKFLAHAEQTGRVINVTDELPRSFIVSQKNDKTTVHIAQISPATLKKRLGFIRQISL